MDIPFFCARIKTKSTRYISPLCSHDIHVPSLGVQLFFTGTGLGYTLGSRAGCLQGKVNKSEYVLEAPIRILSTSQDLHAQQKKT